MHKQILINVEPKEKRVAVLEADNLEEFYVERQGQERIVGNIYKGVVSAILPGMAAAFVSLGLKKDGFLHVSDVIERPPDIEELISEPLADDEEKKKPRERVPSINKLLKKGQEIIVQVVKEPIGTKGPRLTTHISLPGRHVVLMPYENHIGVSKRIVKQGERSRIKRDLASLKLPKDIGLIVRTAGESASKKSFADEVKYLIKTWEKIKKEGKAAKGPRVLHQEYDLVLRVVRDVFDRSVNRLLVDDKNEFKKVVHFVNSVMRPLRLRVKYYKSEQHIFERFGVEKRIAQIYESRIYLKNKGYIIIEQTEGLVAIDVNTGGFVGKKNLEETAFLTNMEAAREIARQIRLRDMGGIIVIDFIDMEEKKHRQQVFEALKNALKRDKARSKILGISQLGLVEMTRQRMRRSVESLSYKICPYCDGRGAVKSVATVAIEVRRKLSQMLKRWPRREIMVYVHPEVCRHLLVEDKAAIAMLESRFRRKIVIRENPDFHIEETKIN